MELVPSGIKNMKILIAVDASPGSSATIQSVAQRAWPESATLRLFSATYDSPEEATEALNLLQGFADSLATAGFLSEVKTGVGEPGAAILQEALDWGAHWIVVGANKSDSSFSAGSVALEVVAHAHCSVEVIRSRRRTEEIALSTETAEDLPAITNIADAVPAMAISALA